MKPLLFSYLPSGFHFFWLKKGKSHFLGTFGFMSGRFSTSVQAVVDSNDLWSHCGPFLQSEGQTGSISVTGRYVRRREWCEYRVHALFFNKAAKSSFVPKLVQLSVPGPNSREKGSLIQFLHQPRHVFVPRSRWTKWHLFPVCQNILHQFFKSPLISPPSKPRVFRFFVSGKV
jgi:hypothetical protein